jgi:DprA winged helix domain
VERLENEMSSSEVFAALFELELTGKVRQMPGRICKKLLSAAVSFQPAALSWR